MKTLGRRRALLALAVGAMTVAIALSSSALGAFDHAVRAALLLPTSVSSRQLEAVRDLTAVGGGVAIVGATVIAAALFIASGRVRACVALAATMLGATAANVGFKLLFAKPRPPADESHIAVFTLSYPSGHSLMTGVLSGTLALLATPPRSILRQVAVACAIVVTVAVGVSRVRLGAHWPTDVIAGWMMAAAIIALLAIVSEGDVAKGTRSA